MDKNCGGTLACRYSKVFSLQLSAHLLELMLLSSFSPHAKWSFYPIYLSHHLYISLSLSYVTHTMWVWQDPFSKSLKSYPLKFYMHLHSYMQRWPRLSLLQNFTFIRRVYQPKWPLYWDSSRLCWYNISEKKKKKLFEGERIDGYVYDISPW